MTRSTEVGMDPCRAEGGCPHFAECKRQYTDCHSFRMYVSGRPRIGVDLELCKKYKGYKFITDRGLKRRRLKEYAGLFGPFKEKKAKVK